MPRVRRGFKARRRRNRVMRYASGYFTARGHTFRQAIQQVHNAWQDAYEGRKQKKRDYRRLWITRINAAARQNEMSYSRLMKALRDANIRLDRKVLADIALRDPGGFKAVVDEARGTS